MKESWDACSVETQARILAYHQIRGHDESEEKKAMVGAGIGAAK